MSAAEADAARGLFETLLVVDGRPVELDAHLRRLDDSCKAMLGLPLPREARRLALQHAAGIGLGRLRITLLGEGKGTRVEAQASPVDPAIVFPTAGGGVELRTLRLPGGLGSHKLVDRRSLESVREPAVALLLDEAGDVLEASRANVFVVRGDEVITPPADGRILAGIAREGVIAVARELGIRLTEAKLSVADLLAANEVFLTGSVRGVQHAGSIDGAALQPAGDISRRLADGLRKRWGLDGAR